MRRALLTGCIGIAIVISAGGGFWFGLRQGWELALMADSAHIGFVAVPRLIAIRSGHVNALNTALELDVDNGLIWSHHFFQSALHPYLAPVWGLNGYPENRKDMARLAGYRRTYPSPSLDNHGAQRPLAQSDSGDPIADELLERRQIIDAMVRRFAPEP